MAKHKSAKFYEKRVLFLHEMAFSLFYEKGRDYANNPYIMLRKAFENRGYKFDIKPEVNLKEYSFIFSIDLYSQSLTSKFGWNPSQTNKNREIFFKALDLGLGKRMVVLLSECQVIAPQNHVSIDDEIGVYLTWDKSRVDNKKIFHYCLPINTHRPPVKNVPFGRKKFLMNISGHKFSGNSGELYSLRRNTIKELEKLLPIDFALYGVGWNKNGFTKNIKRLIKSGQIDFHDYKSYKGIAENKSAVISKYKFNICFENACFKDYITEKVFDVLLNNSIPIYLGATNITDYLDPGTFIDRRDFESNLELISYLRSIDKKQYNEYRARIDTYLNGKKFSAFSEESFIDNIFYALKEL